jgi:hypothetical protein
MKVGCLRSLFLPSSRRKSLNPALGALRPNEPYTARKPGPTPTVNNPQLLLSAFKKNEYLSWLVQRPQNWTRQANVRINLILRRVHIKHCHSGVAIIIIYSECVPVALIIQYKKHMCRACHLWPLWVYHIFPHYLIKDTMFGEKRYWT